MKQFWNNEKINELSNMIIEGKNLNIATLSIFKKFASQYSVSFETVRNFFYKNIDCFARYNPSIVNLVSTPKKFSDKDMTKIEDVLALISNGSSVRKACLDIGKTTQMALRLQNKIRWLTKKNMLSISPKKVSLAPINYNNIIPISHNHSNDVKPVAFEEKQLSNLDLQKLFNGIVKLIKKSVESEYKSANESVDIFNKYELPLQQKNKTIETLQKNNQILHNKLKELQNQILELKTKSTS